MFVKASVLFTTTPERSVQPSAMRAQHAETADPRNVNTGFAGRISVFAEPSAATRAAGKKGGEWVYATHDLAHGPDVLACIQQRMMSGLLLFAQSMLMRHYTWVLQLPYALAGIQL